MSARRVHPIRREAPSITVGGGRGGSAVEESVEGANVAAIVLTAEGDITRRMTTTIKEGMDQRYGKGTA